MASEPKIEVVLGNPYIGEYVCYTYFMNGTMFNNREERYDIMKSQVIKMLDRFPKYEKYWERVQFVDNPKELQFGFDDVLRTGVGYLITIAIKPIHQKKKTDEQKLIEIKELIDKSKPDYLTEFTFTEKLAKILES